MKKLNNKGFVLAETLVVATFVMGIFAIFYNNFYPLMSEYEKRETYDDIDSKYSVFWIKRLIQLNSYNATNMINNVNSNGFYRFTCNDIVDADRKKTCDDLLEKLEVSKTGGVYNIYITKYNLTTFKNKIRNNNAFSSSLQDYVLYLPDYKKESLNFANYRIIAEFERIASTSVMMDDAVVEDAEKVKKYYSYSTIEVKK